MGKEFAARAVNPFDGDWGLSFSPLGFLEESGL